MVVGNADYAEDPLLNATNDVRAMSEALRMLGFEVMHFENMTGDRMREALREFERRLDAGGVGLFYFSGHGLQVGTRTLLVPVDEDRRHPSRLLAGSIDVRTVVESMSHERPGRLNLVILDACLNDPFQSGTEGRLQMADQTLVGYATSFGSFAADGARHGVYTAELLKAIGVPGQEVEDMFRRVEAAVSAATGYRQTPRTVSSLSHGFRFAAGAHEPRALAVDAADDTVLRLQSRAILPKDSAEQYELAFWESIKDSTHASDYEAYLQAYPKGRFAGLARARIERLRAKEPKTEAPPAVKTQPETPPPAKAPPERARAAPAPAKPAPAPRARTEPAAPPPAAAPGPDAASGGAASFGEARDCPECPVLVGLPAGAFVMGSNTSDPSERPAHRVTLKGPFAIGKTEVTVGEWNACVTAGGCPRVPSHAGQKDNTPARDISWEDAQQYVKWLGKKTGKSYRLPTEAEWEYAARGGTSTRYWWGEQMRAGNANCKDCGDPYDKDGPVAVATFAPNPYGLHDMNGSVWEWVSDCWRNSFTGAPTDGRSWDQANCRDRVIRGGSWRDGASYMPSTTRFKYSAAVRHSQNGFRVARDL